MHWELKAPHPVPDRRSAASDGAATRPFSSVLSAAPVWRNRFFGQEGWPSSTVVKGVPSKEDDQSALIDVLQDWKSAHYQELVGEALSNTAIRLSKLTCAIAIDRLCCAYSAGSLERDRHVKSTYIGLQVACHLYSARERKYGRQRDRGAAARGDPAIRGGSRGRAEGGGLLRRHEELRHPSARELARPGPVRGTLRQPPRRLAPCHWCIDAEMPYPYPQP